MFADIATGQTTAKYKIITYTVYPTIMHSTTAELTRNIIDSTLDTAHAAAAEFNIGLEKYIRGYKEIQQTRLWAGDTTEKLNFEYKYNNLL